MAASACDLADARFAGGDHIDRVVEEGAAAQSLELLADERRELLELQRAEGLVGWQAREPQQASDAMLVTLDAFGPHQLVQERLVGQVGLGGFERQVLVQRRRSPATSARAASAASRPGDQAWAASRPSRRSYMLRIEHAVR